MKKIPIDEEINDRHPLPEDRPDFPTDVDDGNDGGGGGGVTPPRPPKTWWQKHGITVVGLSIVIGIPLIIILISLLGK